MVGGGVGCRAEVDGGEEDVVGLSVEAHGFGAEFGFYGFGFAEFVGPIFVENVDHAFAGGDEDEAGFGFEGGGVYSTGDWKRRENFTGVGIEDDELLRIAAGAEEAVVLDVDGESGGRSGRGERPTGFDFLRAGIDGDEFSFVFDIDEKGSCAVGDSEFWAAA